METLDTRFMGIKNAISRMLFFRRLNKQLKKLGAKAWPVTNYKNGVIMQIQYGNDYTQMAVGPRHYKDKQFFTYLVQELENKRLKELAKHNGIKRYFK